MYRESQILPELLLLSELDTVDCVPFLSKGVTSEALTTSDGTLLCFQIRLRQDAEEPGLGSPSRCIEP